jgi:hypothetical protein
MIAITQNRARTNGHAEATIELSSEDWQQLLLFESRCDYVRDRTRSVAYGYQNALFLTGRSGSGKSFLVTQTLKEIGALHTYRCAHMTALGLFHELETHCEHVVVLDDIGSLFDDRQALQILLAALGGKPGESRQVTYSTANRDGRKKFDFTGGIIAISNSPLRRDPLGDALHSRMVVQEHEPLDPELAAFMRYLATRKFMDLSPSECRVVVEFIISESRLNDYRLDLRSMEQGWQDYRQWRDGKSHRTWKELIRANMTQPVRQAPRAAITKQQEIELECEQVLRLEEKYPGNRTKQIAESGLTQSTFYERRRMAHRRA